MGRADARSLHSFLLFTWLKVRRREEIERNMTRRCQGQSEDVCPYLWPCQINKTVVVKLAVRSKNLAVVATTPHHYNVGKSPFWPLTGHFMAETIGAAGLRWKTELCTKINLCCTWQFISINHQHKEGSWPWMAWSPWFLLISTNHHDTQKNKTTMTLKKLKKAGSQF